MVCSINIDETPLRPNVRPAKPKSKRGPVTFFVDIEAPNGRSVIRNLTRGVNDIDDDYTPTPQPPVDVSLETLLLSLSLSSTFYWDTPVAFDPITADFFLQQFEVGVGGNIDVPDLELSVDIETTAQASISRAPIVVDLTLPQVTTNKTITFEPIDIGLSLPNLESNIETSVDTIVIDLTLPALITDKETSFDPISLTMSLPESQVVSDIYGDLAVVDLSVAGTLDVGININLPASMESAQDDDTPSFDSSLLLDTYSSAAAAYSVRKLSSTYSGPCMKVRKDDGVDTGTDIGFDSNGNLNTADIEAHCGTDNGYVVTWYDQSGSGNDATQATAGNQPQIYNGTAVITDNNRPCLYFPTTQILSAAGAATVGNRSRSQWSVFSLEAGTDYAAPWSAGLRSQIQPPDSNLKPNLYVNRTGGSPSITAASGINLNQQYLRCDIADTVTAESFIDGSSVLSGSDNNSDWATSNLVVAQPGDRGPFKVAECILYESDQSTNRTGITSNINTYFSVYS
jgi:hypothetical protein